jgi:hypothetical protein
MKKIHFFLFTFLLILAIYIIFHSFENLKSDSFAINITPTSGITADSPILVNSPIPPVPTLGVATSEVQILKAKYGPPEGFFPYQFTVDSGIPVRLEVLATEDGIGCMGSLMVPDFSTQVEFFEKGKTSVIEFTPTTPGLYYITCGMGIPHATITVN